MINAKDLNRCIDILAELNVDAPTNKKRLILEIGYILKQELDTVNAWNSSQMNDRNRGRQRIDEIDVKKLLEDNTQLFNENQKLLELNMKLRDAIEHRIPNIEQTINGVNKNFESLQTAINKL